MENSNDYYKNELDKILGNEEAKKSIHWNEEYSVYVLDNSEVPVREIPESNNKPMGTFLILSRKGDFMGQVQTNKYTKSGVIPAEFIVQAVIDYAERHNVKIGEVVADAVEESREKVAPKQLS